MSSRAPSPAQLQSTLLHAQALHGHSSAHLEMLLFRYIETLPINHAMRVVGRWPEDSAPGVYAASVLGALPANYFQQPRLLPVGPRFVFMNGILTLARIDEALPMQQLHPDSTTGCVGTSILDVLPSPLSQRRLRPLNSFMIFRSFCSPMFPGIPQKVKSTVISQLWEEDTMKPQWAVLAKAYTLIRDHFEVDHPSLPAFVKLVAPLIGLGEPDVYLKACGWKIRQADDHMEIVREGNSNVPRQFSPNPLSVYQVVQFCEASGYAKPRDGEWPRHILPDGAVFAVDPGYNGTVAEPQNWIIDTVPQWPIEEFEADEMYSVLDPERDQGIDIIYQTSAEFQQPLSDDAVNNYLVSGLDPIAFGNLA
ncbi:Mating type protein [Penicillium canescens]|uniref:Mating type protein n=1 Tax=Penicillium canescens TaxID=5083 RepID=A0AAD6I0S0_PENCN|nr:Mating type protein [Penicillium canescens]KAJ6040084.1 Mating type protein [Penicillium canescens]